MKNTKLVATLLVAMVTMNLWGCGSISALEEVENQKLVVEDNTVETEEEEGVTELEELKEDKTENVEAFEQNTVVNKTNDLLNEGENMVEEKPAEVQEDASVESEKEIASNSVLKEEISTSKEAENIVAEEEKQEAVQVIPDNTKAVYQYTTHWINTYDGTEGDDVITIELVGGKPVAGSKIIMSGTDSATYAELDINDNRYKEIDFPNAPVSNYTIEGNPAKVYAWINSWECGFDDIIIWNQDGTVECYYDPSRLVKIQ